MARLDPHSYTDISQGEVERLRLTLIVDFPLKRLRGVAELELAEAASGDLDLDTRDLLIDSITVEGAPVAWKLHPVEKGQEFMGARLSIERPRGTKRVTIAYRTTPAASALQWLSPENTAGGEHPYLFSQSQPIHARSMVPIQDSPKVRFSFEAEVDVADPLVAVLAAAPGKRVAGETGRALFRFEMPQRIPSYLLALAVGNIAHKDLGPRTRVYAEPETLDAAAWEFEDVEKMLTAAEALFGPYLWERFDFIVMPPAFPYGGMENPRLTFLTPTLIAGDRSLVNVLAHELAHSWTGNLVTNATMNDFWLNEGFTVWAERRILEALEGEDAVALAAAIGRHDLDEEVKRVGADSPFTHLETDLAGTDPDEVYSVVPYEKGFLFVTLLEAEVGREDFDAFLRAYLERFKFTSITTAQFLAFVEEVRPGLLERVGSEKWVHGPGIPENAPTFHSAHLEDLEALAAGFGEGLRPVVSEAKAWSAEDWQIYLQRLPRSIDDVSCRFFDETFALGKSGNAEILAQWLTIAAGSAYEPAYARIREFLGSVGRMKFLKPLYKALLSQEKTAKLAQEIFATAKDAYHPIARGVLEGMLAAK
ncbi:MAG: M1 family metallopeptidase [Deltaproteobacteria bacterium]|nr:M1 family metallopeptidase [Deltaproteobacteria bacterium]